MVGVYILCLDNELTQMAHDRLFALSAPDVQTKCKSFARKEDGYRTLFGLFLARYAIREYFGLQSDQILFVSSETGKPLVAGRDDVWFNISHSGDWVVCVVSHKPVGVDIELIQPVDISIYKDYFSEREYADLLSKSDNEQLSYFYDLWTLKESYVKQQGEGLSIPLNSFTIVQKGSDIVSLDIPGVFFHQYHIDNYKLSVCASDSIFDKLKQITLHQL